MNTSSFPSSLYNSSQAALANDIQQYNNDNWLYPFYILCLPSLPPTSLQDSIDQSTWQYNYNQPSNDNNIINIAIPTNISCLYIKIQRVGYGSLSLAEVQIYASRLNTFANYQYGSPIHRSSVTYPYQPIFPFSQYCNYKSAGLWTVHIQQDEGYRSVGVDGYQASIGTISDVVLVVTDRLGRHDAFY